MSHRTSLPLHPTEGDDKKKRKVEKGTWDFGIDGKNVQVEGKMITKRSGKKKFVPKSRANKKMFRVIDRNKRKGIKG
jgi:hypothetical protein